MLHFVFRVSWILVLLIVFAEVMLYPGVMKQYTGIPSYLFALIYGSVLVVQRIFFHFDPSTALFKYGYFFVGPLIALAAILFTFLEQAQYANYVYSHFGINPSQFFVFYIVFVVLLALNADLAYLRKRSEQVLFTIPIYYFPIILLFYYYPDLHALLKGENQFVEMTQVVLFGTCTYYSYRLFRLSVQTTDRRKYIVPFIYLSMTLVLFLITAEEISWGQRLLEIEAPASITKDNLQDELNIHNNKYVFQYVYFAYGLVSSYAAFFWMVPRYIPSIRRFLRKYNLSQFVIPWYLMLYFILNLLYVLVRKIHQYTPLKAETFVQETLMKGHGTVWQWEEYSELLLAIGLFLFLFRMYQSKQLLKQG